MCTVIRQITIEKLASHFANTKVSGNDLFYYIRYCLEYSKSLFLILSLAGMENFEEILTEVDDLILDSRFNNVPGDVIDLDLTAQTNSLLCKYHKEPIDDRNL